MSRLRRIPFVVAVGLALLPALAAAQRVEVRSFDSLNVTSQQFLTGTQGERVTVAGVLRIPAGVTGPVGAVVLLHGSGGIVPSTERWVDELNQMGLATFLVDSFSGRGVLRTVGDQSQVDSVAMMVDAYRALALLGGDARIDPARIAVLGGSKGALAALYSSSQRFTTMYAATGMRFAAHVALYAPCYYRYRDEDRLTGSPIRLFHGDADDVTPIGPCRELVARLTKVGTDASLTTFAGARHGYDTLNTKPVPVAMAQNLGGCRLEEREPGILVNVETGRPFTLSDACVRQRDTTIAPDAQATAATLAAVRAFFRMTLRANDAR